MGKVSGTYKFTREPRLGFLWTTTAATDAAGVLHSWELVAGRSVEVVFDNNDDILIATLTFEERETNVARDDLDDRCLMRALVREAVDAELYRRGVG